MILIKLTQDGGEPCYINPAYVTSLFKYHQYGAIGHFTDIYLAGGATARVTESFETVVNLLRNA